VALPQVVTIAGTCYNASRHRMPPTMPSHPSFWLLFTLLALPALAELPDVVESVGQYGSDYLSDWSDLPTGDQLARHYLAGLTFQAVSGETARRSWQGQEEVRLTGLPSVAWTGEPTRAHHVVHDPECNAS